MQNEVQTEHWQLFAIPYEDKKCQQSFVCGTTVLNDLRLSCPTYMNNVDTFDKHKEHTNGENSRGVVHIYKHEEYENGKKKID